MEGGSLNFLKKVNYHPDTIRTYSYLQGDFHRVLFSRGRKSKKVTLNIIKNYPGIKWKLIRFLILLNLHKLVVGSRLIGTLKLRVDTSLNYPGEIILIDHRKKVFDLKNEKIYYILEKKSDLLKEISIRKKFPRVNFAPLVKLDTEKKIIIVGFLDLKMFSKIPKTPFKILQNSFNQLIYFYKKNPIKKKKFGKEIEEIWKRNKNFEMLSKKNEKIMHLAYKILNDEKKFVLVRAHRDFHLAHIGKSKQDGKIYILDWENPKEENILFDLFWMVLVDYKMNGKECIKKLIYKKNLNKTPFKKIILGLGEEFGEEFDLEMLLRYFMLTLIKLIEGTYKNGKLSDVKIEFRILRKITRLIKRIS